MKRIVNLILLSICLLVTSSCTSIYYYSSLNVMEEEVVKVDNGDFLFENDSLWIAHCFKGEDAPIQITIFNKLDVPLYVDWSRSALILNNTPYPYSKGEINYGGMSESTTYGDLFWTRAYHTQTMTRGTIELPNYVTFIPPKTVITHNTLRLFARFDEISNKEYLTGKLGTRDGQGRNIKRINYDTETSPLHFGSYITVYTMPEKPQAYRSNFYVNHLIKTKVKPEDLPADMADRGDMFYQCKRPNNTGWEVLGSIGIMAGVAAVDVLIWKDDY